MYSPFIAIALPAVVYFLLKNTIKNSFLLVLIAVLFSCLYSGIQYFLLSSINRESSDESQPTLYPAIYLNAFSGTFLILSIISFLSIITAFIKKSEGEWIDCFFGYISLMMVLSTYLLSRSYSFTSTNIEFIATGRLNIILDLLMVLCIFMISTITSYENHYPIFAAVSTILVLVRSYREKYAPFEKRKHKGPITKWRVITLIFILAVITDVYKLVGCGCLFAFCEYLGYFRPLYAE
ncbi:DUF2463 domain-containing protein [Encephalitozoon hellem]|uniref:DUF2463 domain-containing protein n=1 Tax=Encephalitozoon hellem TaxID=27973 RepID=A0ABY8CNJ1_ENCHE|nr:DUF2463 domain-containing protein [Encephalitozoon hellem]